MLQDIPYRCARCSGARTFNTIAELKSHMADEHAYGQKRERMKIFDFKFTDHATRLGRHSPVLQSYLDEGKRLEEEVRRAKKDELNNKLQRYQQVSSKPRQLDESLFTSFGSKGEVKLNFTTTARQYPEQDAYLQETLTNLNQEVLVQRHNNWHTADTLYKAQEVLAGVEEAAENCVGEQKNVILQLSKELTAKELQIQRLNMELKKLQDNRVTQNQTAGDTDEREGQESKEKLVIEEEISKKKTELEYISNKLFKAKQDLKNKKQRDKKRSQKQDDSEQVKTTNFNKNVATDSSYVTTEEDLSDYSTSQASYSLSKTFSTTTRDRSPNIKSPKHDKVSKNELRQKRLDHHRLHQESQASVYPEQLRAERQELLQRMKEMLSKAAFENEKLKDKLVAKENQLHSLNYELEKSKTDQTELMEETYDLYREAEKNLTKLKEMLKVKEAQLGLATSRLDEFRNLQEQLSKEKETIAKDADEKDSHIQNLIKERDEQIQQLSRQLIHFQEEQERLSVVAADLKKEVLAKEKTHEDLQKAITDKEQELKKAKEDLETLSTFLQTAAAKESIARSKLESFVTELIDRADKAEQELQMLRRIGSSSSSSANLTFNPSQASGAFPNASAVPVQGSAVFSASLPPQPYALNSMPLSHLNHTQPLHPYGDQILQTSLEPWYKNLGLVKDSGNSPKTVPAEVAAVECSIGGTCNELSSLHQSVHPRQSQLLPSQSQISASGCFQPDDAARQQLRMHRKSSAFNSLYPEQAPRQISDSSEEFAPLPARRPVPKQRRQPQCYIEEQTGKSYRQVPSESKSRLRDIPPCSPDVYEVTRSPLHFGNISANARRQSRYGADHVSDEEQESYHSDSSAFHPPHPQYDNHSHLSMSHNAEKKMVRGKNKMSRHLDFAEGHQPSCLPDKHHKNSAHKSSSQKHSLSRDATCSLSQNPEMIEDIGMYKTYTVLSMSGKAVEDPAIFSQLNKYSTDLEQSTSIPSKQKSSRYSEKQQQWKGKHSLSIPCGKLHLKQMQGGAEISSLDGLELSLDDDGIMWEAANVNSDAFDSNRVSPYGSETTGDVDSSVLCSTRSHTNNKSTKGDDTDEDVVDLQEEDSLQMLALPEEELQEKAAEVVPLGERISRILKSVAKEENNETDSAINNCHDKSNPPISQQKRESPLDRAMAVRERVKSMTLPRARERSPSEGPPSQLVQKSDANYQREHLSKQRTEPHGVAQANIIHKTQPEFDTLDDMSSSSYAAVNIKPAYGQSVGEKGIAGSGKGVDKMLNRFELAEPGEDQGKAGERLCKPPSSPGREMLPKMDGAHVLPDHQHQALHERCSPPETGSPSTPATVGTPTTCKNQHLETQSTEVSEKGILVHDNLDSDASKIKKQFSTSGSPFMRQASIMLEEQNLQQFETAALKPAKELRARFMSSHSSSEDSSLHSLSLPAKPVTLTNQEDESTDMDMDYDLESDLQNLSVPGVGRGHGVPSGRPTVKKARALQRKPRISRTAGARYGKPAILPEITDESSSAASDADLGVNRQQEEKRRRRIALFCVFSYLDVLTLGIVALVCKEWRRISRHPALWRRVQIKYQCVSSKFLITISKWCTQLTSLTLEGLRAGQRQAGETLDEYNRRTKACLEPGLEELLKVSQDSLTTVSIVACSNILTDKCLWLVSGYCRLLERLTYISDTHPLTAEVMWALGGGCPSITSLMVPPLHTGTLKQGLTNRCLLLMAQFYPDLLQLGIGGHALDATGLVPLVQSCQRLQFLSLNHIKELKDDTVAAMCKAGLRQLQRLELNCIPLKAEAIRNFYNSCRHLKELRVTVSIHDYWEDARKKKNREDYKKILASLEELKSQAGLGNILRLQAASVD